jgi:hypothetical protein
MRKGEIKRMGRTVRRMNHTEKNYATQMAASIHLMIRLMDKLEMTPVWRNELKLTGNKFLSELEQHAKETLWTRIPNSPDLDDLANEVENISQMFINLMTIFLEIDGKHLSQQQLFFVEMQKCFKRFDMPLRLNTEGLLEFINTDRS